MEAALSKAVNLQKQGKLSEAEAIYIQVLQAEPLNAAATHLLGMLRYKQGQHQDAISLIKRSISISPIAASYSNLSLVQFKAKLFAEAEESAARAIQLDPQYPKAHVHLGWSLLKLKKSEQAVECFRRAIELQPNSPSNWNNLAIALMDALREEEAVEVLRRALALDPNYVEALGNLGKTLGACGQPEQGIEVLLKARSLSPDNHELALNLGVLYENTLRFNEARQVYDDAIAVHPKQPQLFMNRSHIHLHLGNYAQGWADMEARWKCEESETLPDLPMWDGSHLNGQAILVVAERGLGDVIQFVRFVDGVAERGGRVIVYCQSGLARLLQRMPSVDQVVERGQPLPECSYQVPMMSLPRVLQRDGDVGISTAYLSPAPDSDLAWRDEVDQIQGFKVGIAWQGSQTYKGDRTRSIPLSHYLPLASVPGVQLCSLQRGYGTEQILSLEQQGETRINRLDQESCDMMQTAGLMQSLNLIITSDTSLAHLAGALGLPTWVALQYAPDWRWGSKGDSCAWYPTLRLFRQPQAGDWQSLFSEMAVALKQEIASRT